MQSNRVSVFIKSMRVSVRIGIHDHERAQPQPIDVSAELFCDLADYLRRTEKRAIILDYDKIARAVQSWESRPHVDLLETYLKELLALAFSFPQVQEAHITISKPEIFPLTQGAGVSVRMGRSAYYETSQRITG